MALIEVKDITKIYSKKTVLEGIALSINEGEIFGVIGKNGAGKSTFINILTGLVKQNSGDFIMLGHYSEHIDNIKQYMGVMPDTMNFYNNMKAINFLKYMMSLKKLSVSEEEITRLLEKLDLKGHEKKKIKTYSFGMKKKLSFMQAIAGNPKIVFLDEPTSGLDPESAKNIEDLIFDINKNGTTVILTSHNLNEIETLCHRIAVINKGRLENVGSMIDFNNKYNSALGVNIQFDYLDAAEEQRVNNIIKDKYDLKSLEANNLIIAVQSYEEIPAMISELSKNIKIYFVQPSNNSLKDIYFNYIN